MELNKSKVEREAKKLETDVVSSSITSIRSVNRAIARFRAAKKLYIKVPDDQVCQELYQLFYQGAKWHPAWEEPFQKSDGAPLGRFLKDELDAPALRGRVVKKAAVSDPIPDTMNLKATLGPTL